jgi:hypothetical protein
MVLVDKWKILISIEIDWYVWITLSLNVFLVKILNKYIMEQVREETLVWLNGYGKHWVGTQYNNSGW